MMVYICTKFHENILNGIGVMEGTRKVNGRTDGRPHRRSAQHNTTRLRRAYKNKSCPRTESLPDSALPIT